MKQRKVVKPKRTIFAWAKAHGACSVPARIRNARSLAAAWDCASSTQKEFAIEKTLKKKHAIFADDCWCTQGIEKYKKRVIAAIKRWQEEK
mgnify:CR=1 FL=1